MTTSFDELWPKFQDPEYRNAFAAQTTKEAIGYQIRTLLAQHNLSQTDLANRAGISQGVVSRAADPEYGNLTINTLVRIAAGFDVAFFGAFVPFSELPKWYDRIDAGEFAVPSFDDEKERLSLDAVATTTETTPTTTEWLEDVGDLKRKDPHQAPPRAPQHQTPPRTLQLVPRTTEAA